MKYSSQKSKGMGKPKPTAKPKPVSKMSDAEKAKMEKKASRKQNMRMAAAAAGLTARTVVAGIKKTVRAKKKGDI